MKSLICNVRSLSISVLQIKVKKDPTAFYSYSRSELNTKETVDSIDDGTVVAYDHFGIANIINDFFGSVFTNNKFPRREPAQIFSGCLDKRLAYTCISKDDECKLLKKCTLEF